DVFVHPRILELWLLDPHKSRVAIKLGRAIVIRFYLMSDCETRRQHQRGKQKGLSSHVVDSPYPPSRATPLPSCGAYCWRGESCSRLMRPRLSACKQLRSEETSQSPDFAWQDKQ